MLRDVPQERDPLTDTKVPKSETNRAKGAPQQVSKREPGTSYWLISKNENGQLEILATDLAGGEEAMPVFSHEQEAEMFLGLWEVGFYGWQAWESTVGEILSVLCAPCASVERVAVDPLPEMGLERIVGLVSLSRERFSWTSC